MTRRPLRICIDARIDDAVPGGVQQTLLGLATGLSRLGDGDEEYSFWTLPGRDGWLADFLRGPCRSLLDAARRPATGDPRWKQVVRSVVSPRVVEAVAASPLGALLPVHLPSTDGTIERLGVDVMHFALPFGFETAVPSLFVPHDLQHLHHPEYFSPYERRARDATYAGLSRQARAVVALSHWGKADLVRGLSLPEDKVRVVGWAPALDLYPAPSPGDVNRTRRDHGLPEAFLLYPAQTWPHKNHVRLLEALAVLRDGIGLEIPAVFTGRRGRFFPVIERAVKRLRLADQVRFLGFVSPVELQCLYRTAKALVYPSEFEGFGLPIAEAFRAGLPVACSTATCIPEQAGEAAIYFSPRSVTEMADAIARVWSDEPLRERLRRAGMARIEGKDWDRVARTYRAIYRLLGQRPVTPEDRSLIAESLLRPPSPGAVDATSKP